MRLICTEIGGVFLVEAEPVVDERGCFARTFDRHVFLEHGLDPTVEQQSVAFNARAGTVRGMHYQVAPALETKLVRCTRGQLLDVVVDLRPDSVSYRQHVAVELTAENHVALYVPPLCAHGYQTLTDGTEVTYQMNTRYAPDHARGVRHDDPALGISWPLAVTCINEKDRRWPLLT